MKNAHEGRYLPRLEGAPSLTRGETPGKAPEGRYLPRPNGRNVPARGERSVTPGNPG